MKRVAPIFVWAPIKTIRQQSATYWSGLIVEFSQYLLKYHLGHRAHNLVCMNRNSR